MVLKIIKKRSMFLNVSQTGSVARTRGVVSLCKSISEGDPLVGFTASRKVGNAVRRNFAKRRLKELAREFEPELKPGFIFVFVATKQTPQMEFAELRNNFKFSVNTAKEMEKRRAEKFFVEAD